jgi:hypothetical protein
MAKLSKRPDAAKAEDAARFVAEADRLAPPAIAVHNAGGNESALHRGERREFYAALA